MPDDSPFIPPPGHGGWVPPAWFPIGAGMFLGGGGSLVPVLTSTGPLTARTIIAAVLAGLMTGLAGFVGIKSAGPRAP